MSRDVVITGVGALERHAVLVLDDLRELGQVERVDVEILERRVTRDGRLVDAELRQRLVDGLLDVLFSDGGGHVCGLLGVEAIKVG